MIGIDTEVFELQKPIRLAITLFEQVAAVPHDSKRVNFPCALLFVSFIQRFLNFISKSSHF